MAEGPGAELSICYQKVSGHGAVRRWPEVPLEGGTCQEHGGGEWGTKIHVRWEGVIKLKVF